MIDFSVNVTPLGIPENIQKAIRNSLDMAGCYPDYSKERLKRALAGEHHLEESQICVGNGASDVIFRLVFAFRPQHALVLAPTFGEYEAALKCVETDIDYYRINHDNFQVEEDILEQIHPDTDMVFLCNPNNPTGLLMSKTFVEKVLECCEKMDARLVVDECFLEFIKDGDKWSVTDKLMNHKGLVIIKSFTKMFGIAGLRLGYLMCGEEGLADKVDHFGCDWNVNCVAEAAGLEALKSKDYVEKVVNYISEEREWMYRELTAMGFRVIPGRANYLLFQNTRQDREELGTYLEKSGILVRGCGDYENLDEHFYRIGINRHLENEKLLEAIREWMR